MSDNNSGYDEELDFAAEIIQNAGFRKKTRNKQLRKKINRIKK